MGWLDTFVVAGRIVALFVFCVCAVITVADSRHREVDERHLVYAIFAGLVFLMLSWRVF
jgi:hypothetical protein